MEWIEDKSGKKISIPKALEDYVLEQRSNKDVTQDLVKLYISDNAPIKNQFTNIYRCQGRIYGFKENGDVIEFIDNKGTTIISSKNELPIKEGIPKAVIEFAQRLKQQEETRKALEQRAAEEEERKAAEQRAAEQRAAEQRAAKQRAAAEEEERKAAEQRAAAYRIGPATGEEEKSRFVNDNYIQELLEKRIQAQMRLSEMKKLMGQSGKSSDVDQAAINQLTLEVAKNNFWIIEAEKNFGKKENDFEATCQKSYNTCEQNEKYMFAEWPIITQIKIGPQRIHAIEANGKEVNWTEDMNQHPIRYSAENDKRVRNLLGENEEFGRFFQDTTIAKIMDINIIDGFGYLAGADFAASRYAALLGGNSINCELVYDFRGIYQTNMPLDEIKAMKKLAKAVQKSIGEDHVKIQKESPFATLFGTIRKKWSKKSQNLLEEGPTEEISAERKSTAEKLEMPPVSIDIQTIPETIQEAIESIGGKIDRAVRYAGKTYVITKEGSSTWVFQIDEEGDYQLTDKQPKDIHVDLSLPPPVLPEPIGGRPKKELLGRDPL